MRGRPFLFTTLAGLFCIGALNYGVDHSLDAKASGQARTLVPGEVWVCSDKLCDERRVRMSELQWMQKPDVVILGSSRVYKAESWMFRKGITLFNMGVPGCALSDFVGFWQVLQRAGKVPGTVVIFLDPWIMNRKTQFQRYDLNYVYYQDFLYGERFAWLGGIFRRAEWTASTLIRYGYTVKELLTWKHLRFSLTLLKKHYGQGAQEPERSDILPESQASPRSVFFRADGSLNDGADQPMTLAERREMALQTLNMKSGISLDPWDFDFDAITTLRLLLKSFGSQGVKTLLVIPPYAPLAYREILRQDKFRGPLEQYVKASEDLPQGLTDVEVCNAIDPAASHCDEMDFSDGWHTNPACLSRVIQRCLSQAPLFSGLSPHKHP